MSVFLYPGLSVKIVQLEGQFAPRPLPLENGFTPMSDYSVLGMHCPSETADAYLILQNDREEIWFISNRHCRVSKK